MAVNVVRLQLETSFSVPIFSFDSFYKAVKSAGFSSSHVFSPFAVTQDFDSTERREEFIERMCLPKILVFPVESRANAEQHGK